MDKFNTIQSFINSSEDFNANNLYNFIEDYNMMILADEVMISDASGIVLKISQNYENSFGFEHNSIVGKSVFDLEAQGVFSPCVTAMVIRQKKKITTVQNINNSEKNVLTIGIPIFDRFKVLQYVMCFNTVTLEQINSIQKQNEELKDSLKQYTEEIENLRAKTYATDLVFKSKVMKQIWTLLNNTANTKANILITGETGVGKSAIAKNIHKMSNRKNGPFIEVNCTVLNENLIESELFGYEKDTFTETSSPSKIGKIELSNNGTLFLDEIGDLSLHTQSRLLQLIQEKTIQRISNNKKITLDFKLIVTTNRNLEQDVATGKFRSDLFYRLNVLRINIPPLRERRDDIAPLAFDFLTKFNNEYNKNTIITPALLDFLEHHDWPGNVRQLENLIERLVITSVEPQLTKENLPYDFVQNQDDDNELPELKQYQNLSQLLDNYESEIIKNTYNRFHTTVAVAKYLGISQPTAARKIAKYVTHEKKED